MTSKDLHTAILDSNFTVGKRYIGRCSQVYRGKKAIHVACSETYTKVRKTALVTVMLMITLCWWLNDGDSLKILVLES